MSGLSHTPGKRAKGKTFRGFESRLFRQKKQPRMSQAMRGFVLSQDDLRRGGQWGGDNTQAGLMLRVRAFYSPPLLRKP